MPISSPRLWTPEQRLPQAGPALRPLNGETETALWWLGLMRAYQQDPVKFVMEACYTKDPTNLRDSVARIPYEEYITEVMIPAYLSDRPVVAIPKSRRILLTWVACMLNLRLAMWTESATIFVVSKDQTDSDQLVHRCKFVYDRLPTKLPKPRMIERMGKKGFVTRLEFVETGSSITGLDSDPDTLRQEGATLLHCEEFAFWKKAEEAYTAMLPTIQGGGRVRILSSAKALTFFSKLVYDKNISAVSA